MKILESIWKEAIEFFSVLEELYRAWLVSPHGHVIILGRVIFAIIIIMVIVVIVGVLKYLCERRFSQ
jgi:hypothetical protein